MCVDGGGAAGGDDGGEFDNLKGNTLFVLKVMIHIIAKIAHHTMEHRNSQKRFIELGYVYFVTGKTFHNFPYFEEDIFCELWIEELKLCKELKKFKLYGFCLLYDHFHMVVKPGNEFDISKIVHCLKRNFSRDTNKIILSNEGEVPQPRRGGLSTVAISDDMDRRLQIMNDAFIQKYGFPQYKIPPFKWQKSFHDHVIRNQQDFEDHMDYTIFNYRKHGLPENWKYTSLNYESLIDCLTCPI